MLVYPTHTNTHTHNNPSIFDTFFTPDPPIDVEEKQGDIDVQKKPGDLDTSSIQEIIRSLLSPLLKIEAALREPDGDISLSLFLFRILSISISRVTSLRKSIYPRISSLLSEFLALGLSKDLDASLIRNILQILKNIAFAKDNTTKDSILSLLLPYMLLWMKKYPNKTLWMTILRNISLEEDNLTAHVNRSSQLWFVFKPILKSLKFGKSVIPLPDEPNPFTNMLIILGMNFFTNLCSIPSQAIVLYHNLKRDYRLDYWFGVVKLSRLYRDQISPKYDDRMEWCKINGGSSSLYSRYIGNCYSYLHKWNIIFETIEKCPDSESTSKLYHKHRKDILSVFLAFQSKSEIKEHKKEIVLCIQCLDWFVMHNVSGNDIYLPIPDLNDLIDTFLGHLSSVEEVLEGNIEREYYGICTNYTSYYTHSIDEYNDSFVCQISPTLEIMLKSGTKRKLRNDFVQKILATLQIISKSASYSTRSSIFTLIKPYIKDWLRIYDDSKCFGDWMIILSYFTVPNIDPIDISICSEAWPLFHPVLDIVKREFVGNKINEDNHDWALVFFSHLSIGVYNTVRIYENVKDLLENWFRSMNNHHFWVQLIGIFSIVPSILLEISPKFDSIIRFCSEEDIDTSTYVFSIISYFKHSAYSNLLLHSVPMLSIIPTSKILFTPEQNQNHASISDNFATHFWYIEYIITWELGELEYSYSNVLSGEILTRQDKRLKLDWPSDLDWLFIAAGISKLRKEDECLPPHGIKYSSLLTVSPQKLLVKMPFDEERSYLQSVHDLIEQTGGGVEMLFDKNTRIGDSWASRTTETSPHTSPSLIPSSTSIDMEQQQIPQPTLSSPGVTDPALDVSILTPMLVQHWRNTCKSLPFDGRLQLESSNKELADVCLKIAKEHVCQCCMEVQIASSEIIIATTIIRIVSFSSATPIL
ncbi:hypothetical protein ADUPG1_007767 [Aduncisulcus paluster]|uniref:Uncharacterized protein n=1 Tax=Aduncisulcus paluster TaxID=2918883 RepID=A0ABQ5KPI0_9EUKA|nr:hypothetical protein ADUPG1_007767 [Aduncisulcus paluster]